MANPERGEVAIQAGGQTYTLKFSTNAICEAESVSGKSFGELCLEIQKADFRAMRALLWAGLRPAHKDVTLDMAGDILDEVEPLEIREKLDKAIELSYPKTAKVGEATTRPPKAAKA